MRRVLSILSVALGRPVRRGCWTTEPECLVEIDVGTWEQKYNEENLRAWVNLKRGIAEVSLKYGGSLTSCHGATREGDAGLAPWEMGNAREVVKRIKRALDPNYVMNPGTQSLDEAYASTNGRQP